MFNCCAQRPKTATKASGPEDNSLIETNVDDDGRSKQKEQQPKDNNGKKNEKNKQDEPFKPNEVPNYYVNIPLSTVLYRMDAKMDTKFDRMDTKLDKLDDLESRMKGMIAETKMVTIKSIGIVLGLMLAVAALITTVFLALMFKNSHSRTKGTAIANMSFSLPPTNNDTHHLF